MTSKRDLNREVDDLREESDSGDSEMPLYIFDTANHLESRSDAPRPELTVPDDARGGYTTAAPAYVSSEDRSGAILFLSQAVVGTWPGDTDDSTIPVSELWDGLTDE